MLMNIYQKTRVQLSLFISLSFLIDIDVNEYLSKNSGAIEFIHKPQFFDGY